MRRLRRRRCAAASAVKRRILVLGSEHFVAARVHAALSASDWAEAVELPAPPSLLRPEDLAGINAVFNGSMGNAADILANARALYAAVANVSGGLRVVHLGSMTVYGSFTGEAQESTPVRADLGAYGAAQIEAELIASRYPHSVMLRPGCEYGPGCPQWSERIARLLRSHRLGDLGACGDGVCNLLFIDDLVKAVMASLQAPGVEGQRFNLAMRSPPTWNEYFVQLGRALGAVPVSRIGRRRLQLETKLLAPPLKVMEMLERRLRGGSRSTPPAITPSLLHLCRQDITLNAEKAAQALHIEWTPLTEGLRQSAAAYC